MVIGPELNIGIFVDGLNPNGIWGNTKLSTGNWYHIVAVYNEEARKLLLCVNGILDNEVFITEGTPSISNSGFTIGCENENPNKYIRPFNGDIDEVRLYNHAFSESEIQQIYQNESPDADNDGLCDFLESASCTVPNDAETDDDGMTDGTEDANHNGAVDAGETDPCKLDTDGDGIQDGTELGMTLAEVSADTNTDVFQPDEDDTTTTDPLDADSDDDGISDGAEDADHNGRVGAGEYDPNDGESIPSCTVYEDAEDGTTAGWDIYDNDPLSAEITNVFDAGKSSKVINLPGSSGLNGYRFRNADGTNWNNTSQFIIQWSMKTSANYALYVQVATSAGARYITYTQADTDALGTGAYAYFGLGIASRDGQWHTFSRDLKADLAKAQPGVTITAVNAFLVRGNMRLDDIKLLR